MSVGLQSSSKRPEAISGRPGGLSSGLPYGSPFLTIDTDRVLY